MEERLTSDRLSPAIKSTTMNRSTVTIVNLPLRPHAHRIAALPGLNCSSREDSRDHGASNCARAMLYLAPPGELDLTKLSRASVKVEERSEIVKGKSERANEYSTQMQTQLPGRIQATIHQISSFHVHRSRFEVAPQLVACDLASRYRIPALFTSGLCSQIVYRVHNATPTQN
jgi:hypothetical protein